ncbi:MAG: LLM class flavin-dependent oxidoreductase [Actinomycetota bacterium]
MKVSLFTMPTVPATSEERARLRPIGRNAERYTMMIEELRELAVLADGLGFDAFSTTEHHFHTEGGEALPNTLLLYANLAAITKDIMFIPMSMVLPANDPIRVAEDIALFDQMYPGRVGVAFARGYQRRWVPVLSQRDDAIAFGDKGADDMVREIYNEYLEVVIKAWTEDAFEFNGKHYQVPYPHEGITGWAGKDWTNAYGAPGELDEDGVIRKIGVVPKPVQTPYPRLFVPANVSPQTVISAAQQGVTPIFHEGRVAPLTGLMELYRDEAAKAGHDLAIGERIAVLRTICLGDTYEEAFDFATRTIGYEYHNYFNEFGFAELYRTDADDPDLPMRFNDEADATQRMIETGQILIGTADDVKDQLSELQRCHGDGELEWLVWSHFGQGTTPREESCRQLKIFAEKVWPAFKD